MFQVREVDEIKTGKGVHGPRICPTDKSDHMNQFGVWSYTYFMNSFRWTFSNSVQFILIISIVRISLNYLLEMNTSLNETEFDHKIFHNRRFSRHKSSLLLSVVFFSFSFNIFEQLWIGWILIIHSVFPYRIYHSLSYRVPNSFVMRLQIPKNNFKQ